MSGFESIVEEATIHWLKGLGHTYKVAPDLAHDGSAPERRDSADVFFEGRRKAAIVRIETAYASNNQLHDCWSVKQTYPAFVSRARKYQAENTSS